MKSAMQTSRAATMLSTLLLATTVSLSGCAMFGKGDSAKMSATLQSVQDDYLQAKLQTEVTEDDLEELETADEVDLKQAYKTFSKSADDMRQAGKGLVNHADSMHFQGAAYLIEAEKTATACVYPRFRRPEDLPVAESGSYFDEIAEEGWEVKRAYRAFQFDLNEIRDYLAANLTPKAVDSLTPIFAKATVDAESLRNSLQQAIAALERAKVAKAQKAVKNAP
jgi:hypothetical protein